jgi:hypothetical protein
MSYTYSLKENLYELNEVFYKSLEIKLILSDGKIEQRAAPLQMMVSDGINQVSAFATIITGNQQEFLAYFTVDAFGGFSTNSTIALVSAGVNVDEITNVNVTSFETLNPLLTYIPHSIADNTWLSAL